MPMRNAEHPFDTSEHTSDWEIYKFHLISSRSLMIAPELGHSNTQFSIILRIMSKQMYKCLSQPKHISMFPCFGFTFDARDSWLIRRRWKRGRKESKIQNRKYTLMQTKIDSIEQYNSFKV